ncbi:hypothetical protein BIT28_10985 [Photobacterium proteolyticum]|uniref:LRAT domain-containing protein n=1 Tax=Photobacterium proteolyticum TaxID=1903952 RepID=A0A1Q9G6U9_9GAMM|nr:hypothetical protein [Photobacterium proteolyticum]OLQ70053.1 hypothetical protein BIT28_10985 [Photobacterium proteolyticum]
MLGIQLIGALGMKSAVNHVVDKTIRSTVKEPKVGSILYTGLLADTMEHSGVYIGNNRIVELDNKGHIKVVTPQEFINGGTGINIYVSAQGKYPVGSGLIAERAIQYEQDVIIKDYHLLFDNCHMFTAACIIGDFDNSYSYLWMLKDLVKESLSADNWLVWQDPQKCCDKKEIEATYPNYTSQDLACVLAQLQAVREQSNRQWEDIKAHCRLVHEHTANGPASWFCTTESRLENYVRRSQELEQIEYINQRKHDDLLREEKSLEQKVEEITAYVSLREG